MISVWSSSGYQYLPFSGFSVDWIQLIYDATIGLLTGLLIEMITSRLTIKHNFDNEVQDLSRYLSALKQLVELYPSRGCDVEISQLIALSPRHESFKYLFGASDLLSDLNELECEIREQAVSHMLVADKCKQIAAKLFKLRCLFVRLKLPSFFLIKYRANLFFKWLVNLKELGDH